MALLVVKNAKLRVWGSEQALGILNNILHLKRDYRREIN